MSRWIAQQRNLAAKSIDRDGLHHVFASAHLYASDKNSFFIVPYAINNLDGWDQVTSLSMTITFHQQDDKLRMIGLSRNSEETDIRKK
jgi:hypothetical protein